MTSEYMNNLYRDLLSNSPQTVTIPIPSDMGTGQIAQVVTKQGAVVSDWKMNYFSDMNVRGINSEDYIQMLFCLNDGVSWNIAGSREGACLAKGESCIYRGHGKMESLCYCSATSFLRNWDSILEKKRANLRSISEPARLRQPPPRSTGAAHARGRAQSIREERRIAAPPVLFALLWVRLLPALYGPFCGPLRPFGGCPWGVTPPARECLPPAPPDTRRRG